MLSLQNLTVQFRDGDGGHTVTAVDDVTFQVAAGEWIALVGRNGSGKSTLLRAIAGVVAVTDGDIIWDGDPQVAYLHQNPEHQLVASTVEQEMQLSTDSPDDARGAIERFRLTTILRRNPHELSGGEKQRVAFATVWLQRPRVLLLDEPTAFLDSTSAEACTRFVRDLQRDGVAILWATPGGGDIDLAERVLLIEQGRIIQDDTPDAFAASENPGEFSIALSPLRSLCEQLGKFDSNEVTYDALADDIAARAKQVRTAEVPEINRSESVSVGCSSVSFAYGEVEAVYEIDLDVRRGEVVGLFGENSSGKTTVLLLAAGVLTPRSGTVNVTAEAAFYLPQYPEHVLFTESVAEEIGFGLRQHGMSAADANARIASALEFVGLTPERFLHRSPFSLSGGEMRRLVLAVARSLNPDLLLLDEPSAGLDARGIAHLSDYINRTRDDGITVMIASHDMNLLAVLCDRICFLDSGRLTSSVRMREGRLADEWPEGPQPALLDLQSALAVRGLDVQPRELTTAGLRDRLGLS